jgi:RDD family
LSRRLMAFVVDCLLCLGVTIALLYPLTQLDQDRFRIGSPLPEPFEETLLINDDGAATLQVSRLFSTADCVLPRPVPEAVLAPIAPKQADEVWICAERFLGIAAGHVANVIYDARSDGAVRVWWHYSLPVTAAGAVIRPLYPVGIMTFGLMLLLAMLGHRLFRGQTPGKMLTGLRVQSRGGVCTLCREVRRLGPFLVAGLYVLGGGFVAPERAAHTVLEWAATGVSFAFFGFVLWYYLWPAMKGDHLMRHDRATGFRTAWALLD